MTQKQHVIAQLWPLLRLHPWATLGIVVLGVLASLSEGIGISLFIPFLQSLDQTVDSAGTGIRLVEWLEGLFLAIPPERRLYVIAVCILASILLKASLSFTNGVLSGWLDVRISHQLRSDVFRQMLALSYRNLVNSDSGRILNVLTTETWQTSRAIGLFIGLMITTINFIVYVSLLVLLSWQLTLLVLIAMGVIAGVVRYLTRQSAALGQRATQTNTVLATRMLEGFKGMKLIRVFGREPYEQARFDQASERVSHIFWKLAIISGTVHPAYEILAAALLVSILLLTVGAGQPLPVFLVFLFVLYRLQPQVKSLDGIRVGLASVKAGVEEVLSFLDRHDKEYIVPGSQPFRQLSDAIRFRQVTFQYDASEDPVLRDITVDIPAGRITALVGPSGAGKTTFVNLVLRLFEPTEGTIEVDNIPIESLDLVAWRDRMALVSQDVCLFDASVRDNIAYGCLGASDDEIIEAAKLADAHDFILRLPKGYNTQLGSHDIRLSGGQQQRLSLARAIVRDPEILILDEATNALDSLSESVIQQALEHLRQNRTIVIIAHRLSTIESADQIIVLDDGWVREQGTLQHLLERDDLFAQLYHLQYRRALTDVS